VEDRVAQYDEVAEAYEAWIVPRFKPIAQRLLRAADLRPGDRVLDIAAGTGGLARLVAAKIGPHGSLTLVDLSAPMLAIARRVLRALPDRPDGRPRFDTIEADLEQLPIRDESIDVAVAQMSPLLGSDKGLAEAYRVLRPGGRLGVATWGATYQETALLNVARAAVNVEPYPKVQLRAIPRRLERAGFIEVRQRTRPMTARHASLAAYLEYRRAFGTVGYPKEQIGTYFAALEREVRRHVPAGGPIGIAWSITIVTARKA
jgi:SAM-dependent methyltransferase